MKMPQVVYADQLAKDWPQRQLDNGRWVLARPLGYNSWWMRFKLAWRVFVGYYDALCWIGQTTDKPGGERDEMP